MRERPSGEKEKDDSTDEGKKDQLDGVDSETLAAIEAELAGLDGDAG